MHLPWFRFCLAVFVQDQPPFYFVSHVPCLNTLINFHVVLKYGFVGTCPGIEPVTGRSQVQFQDVGHRFNSRTSTHEANFFPLFFFFPLFYYFFITFFCLIWSVCPSLICLSRYCHLYWFSGSICWQQLNKYWRKSTEQLLQPPSLALLQCVPLRKLNLRDAGSTETDTDTRCSRSIILSGDAFKSNTKSTASIIHRHNTYILLYSVVLVSTVCTVLLEELAINEEQTVFLLHCFAACSSVH